MKTFGENNNKPTTGPTVSVKTETAGKIGLIGAVTIIIGAVVGCGVFFKNGGVMRFNHGNGWGMLLGWIIAFVIALATAYSYGEITRCKTKSANSGLAGWAERYVGYRFGRFLKIMYPLFYFAIYPMAIGIFAAEAIFNTNPSWAGTSDGITGINFWLIVLVAAVMVYGLILMNYLNNKIAGKLSGYLAFSKFIPIGLVLLGGIVAGCLFPDNNLFSNPHIGDKKGNFDFGGVIASLPGIMFAFDSFLIVGNVAKQVKNPTKNVPLSIVVSMITAGTIYILITIAQIVSGTGDPYTLVDTLFGNNETLKSVMKVIMSILIFVSVFGGLNSFVFAASNAMQSAIDEEIIIGYKWFKKISNGKCEAFGGLMLMSITSLIVIALICVPSIILNTDAIVDGLTNAITVFIFLVYGTVSFMSIMNRKTNKVPVSEVSYQKGQCIAASIATIGCWGIAGYCLIKQFLCDPIMDGNKLFTGWGLFFDTKQAVMATWQASVWFWAFSIVFFAIPFVHDLFIKLVYKDYKQPLVWQKTNVSLNSDSSIVMSK